LSIGELDYWSIGVLEYWNKLDPEIEVVKSFHYSTTPADALYEAKTFEVPLETVKAKSSAAVFLIWRQQAYYLAGYLEVVSES